MKIQAVFLIFLALAAVAGAQTKIAGAMQCSKPDPLHSINVGDRPGHAFSISQSKCTWTKPVELGATQTKEDLVTGFGEITGNSSRDRGVVVLTMASGEKAYVSTQGTATLKAGAVVANEGKWQFTSAGGKLKGLKGQGTYKCKSAGEGNTCEIEGEYQLPK